MTSEPPSSLDALDGELNDAEIVLACLDRAEPGLCSVCKEAEAAGTLEQRPSLKACADARAQATSG